MDVKIIEFLTRGRQPRCALHISKGVGKVTAKDVNPTLYQLEREGRVQRRGKEGQAPLWSLVKVQGGSSHSNPRVEPSPSQGDPGGKSTAHAEANIPVSSASRSTKPADEAAAVDDIADEMAMLSIPTWKQSLRKHHQKLRTGIHVRNFLPELWTLPLTEVEYAKIQGKPDDVSQVDELIETLCTKTKEHFDRFCSILERNGYEHWTKTLRGENGGDKGEEPSASHQSSHVESLPGAGGVTSPPLAEATPPELPASRTPPQHEQTDAPDVAGQEKLGEENVRFVFITANKNEYVSLMSFLEHPKCRLQDPVGTTFSDIDKLKDRIKIKGSFKDYVLFSVLGTTGIEVNIAVLKCLSMGSSGISGSRMETLKLLLTARDQHWTPEAIFVIGCCGGRNVPDSDVEVGYVCVASKVIHYNKGKIEDEGRMKWKPTTDYGSQITTWCGQVLKAEEMLFPSKKVLCKEIDRFLSGDHVVKSQSAAKDMSQFSVDPPNIAIEMEGLGVAEALKIAEMVNDRVIQDAGIKIPLPEYIIVKGISDLAGHDKNEPCDILFFGEPKENVGEDERQQMCTIMAATLVLRAIVHYT